MDNSEYLKQIKRWMSSSVTLIFDSSLLLLSTTRDTALAYGGFDQRMLASMDFSSNFHFISTIWALVTTIISKYCVLNLSSEN